MLHIEGMVETKLHLLRTLARAEARSPSARSAEVLAKLEDVAALWSKPSIDPRLARAVELMQKDLARDFPIASLARAVGMSRAVFVRKFVAAFGSPPRKHLRDRRMERSAILLVTSDEPLIAIAHTVGYQSEFAFSRAFKQRFGVAPGVYRVARTRDVPVMRLAA